MSRVARDRMTVGTNLAETDVGRVAARAGIRIRVTRITRQLARRIPYSRGHCCAIVTNRRRTVAVRTVAYRRSLTVRHRSTERYRSVNVCRRRRTRVTLRTKRSLVLKMLVMSVRRHRSRIGIMTLSTVRYRRRSVPRVRARDWCTRDLINTVVVTHVRPATRRLNIREVHILDTVTVIIDACVIRVARRTTDRINTKGHRSGKVLRVVAGTRIGIRMTKRAPSRAHIPGSRVRSAR
jgi:hypothetical protein